MENRKTAALLTGMALGTGLGLLLFTKKGTELRGRLGNLAKQKVKDTIKRPHFAKSSVNDKGLLSKDLPY